MTAPLPLPLPLPSSPAALRALEREPRRAVDVDVLRARLGRIAFALGFLVGPVVLAVAQASGIIHVEHVALPGLAAGWLSAALASVVVQRLARGPLARGSGRAEDTFLRASLIAPGVLLALLGPISLHAPIAFLVAGARGVDQWSALGLGLTGIAHVVLVVLVVVRAARLVAGEPAMSARRIYWVVVAASALPGVVWLGIPVVVTAITGLAARPLLQRMQDIVDEERRRLAH